MGVQTNYEPREMDLAIKLVSYLYVDEVGLQIRLEFTVFRINRGVRMQAFDPVCIKVTFPHTAWCARCLLKSTGNESELPYQFDGRCSSLSDCFCEIRYR